jgi:hypothetical protein
MRICALIVLAALIGLCAVAAHAYVPMIAVDEWGYGTYNQIRLQWTVGPDPGPGGLQSTLIYYIPPGAIPGDLILTEPGHIEMWSDLIRWNPGGMLVFYSDGTDGCDAPADTPTPPSDFYLNMLFVTEQEDGTGWSGCVYTPQPGQPGYNPSISGLTYVITSEIPEPGSLPALFTGLAGLGGLALRKRRS